MGFLPALFLALLHSRVIIVDAELAVTYPRQETAGGVKKNDSITYAAPSLWRGVGPEGDFTVTGSLIRYPATTECEEVTDETLKNSAKGKIVIMETRRGVFAGQGCPYEGQAKRAQDLGASACLILSLRGKGKGIPGSVHFSTDGPTKPEFSDFPVAEISAQNFESMLQRIDAKEPEDVIVAVLTWEKNQWIGVRDGWINRSFYYLLSVCNVLILITARKKLLYFVGMQGGWTASVSQLCCTIEIIACIQRSILFSLNPVFSSQLFPYALSNFMMTFSVPLSFASTCLVFLFWRELTHHIRGIRIQTGAISGNLKRNMSIVSGFFFVNEVVQSSLRGFYFDITSTAVMTGVMYTIIQLLVGIAFIKHGNKMVSSMAEMNKSKGIEQSSLKASKERATFDHVSRCVVRTGVLLIAASLFFVLYAMAGFLWSPWGYNICFGSNYFFLTFLSASRVDFFVIRKENKGGSAKNVETKVSRDDGSQANLSAESTSIDQ